MKIYEESVRYKRIFLFISISASIFILIPVLLSTLGNVPSIIFSVFQIIFGISFFSLMFFVILLILAINKGKLEIYDDRIEIRKFKRIIITWSEVKGVDIIAKSIVFSPITGKMIIRKALEIYTNSGKTFSIEVKDPEKIINIIKSKIKI